MAQATLEAGRIARVLGGEKALGVKSFTPLELEQCERSGFPTAVVKVLLEHSVVGPKEMYGWIIARRTFAHRVKKRQRLSVEESNRIARVARAYALAVEMLGDEEKARRWLRKPMRRFAGRSPVKLPVFPGPDPLYAHGLAAAFAGRPGVSPLRRAQCPKSGWRA